MFFSFREGICCYLFTKGTLFLKKLYCKGLYLCLQTSACKCESQLFHRDIMDVFE